MAIARKRTRRRKTRKREGTERLATIWESDGEDSERRGRGEVPHTITHTHKGENKRKKEVDTGV